MDSSKKIYYGMVFKTTQLENTQGHKKTPFFPSLFCLCRPPFPLSVCPTKLGTQQSEKKEGKKVNPRLSKSTSRAHNQPNQAYAY